MHKMPREVLEKLLTNIFHGFRVFEYALWQKTEIWKFWKSTESFLNKKTLLLMVAITRKLLKRYQFIIQVPFWL